MGPYRYQCLFRVLLQYDERRIKIVIVESSAKIPGDQIESAQLDVSPFSLFVGSIRSSETKKKYLQRMGYFFDYLNIHQEDSGVCFEILTGMARADPNWFVNVIFEYLQKHKSRVERKEISSATLRNYVKPIKLYCEQMDFPVPWKKILRGMPKGRRYASDRAPTLLEIRKLLGYPDRRLRPILCTMSSSGIRLSAWDYLKWRHVVPVSRNGQIVAAKISVYADEDEEYFTFISREAFDALNEWMTYRKKSGETIAGESWVMRNLWDVTTPKGKGIITIPRRLKATGIKRLIERALWTQGIRSKLATGRRRHEFQADHGMRKWYKTRCESAGMRSINIETLMGRSLGLSDSYYRPTEEELLNDFLKASNNFLTLNQEQKLYEQVQELRHKSKDTEYLIRSKLREKDQDIELMRQKYDFEILLLKDAIREMQNFLKHPAELEDINS